jgi:hypothetical protein
MTKNITKIMQKATVLLIALFLAVAKCNAQSIDVQPVGTNVLNGGTATFTAAADSGILSILGLKLTWYCTSNNVTREISTSSNISILNEVTNSLLGILLGGNEAVSILTINNVNPTNVGKYYVEATEIGLSFPATSDTASLSIIPAITIASSASTLTTAGFHLEMSTPAGSNVVVEASSDMVNWTPIYTNLDSSGTLTYTDTDATNHTSRCYRARTQ